MANFEEAYRKFIETQGGRPVFENDDGSYILCSDCFTDEGLILTAIGIGDDSEAVCPQCSSAKGKKLTKTLIRRLCYFFFVRGTLERFKYGGAPLIQFNEYHHNQSEVEFASWLQNDVKLIEQAGEIGFFYYGPRFWMLGEIEPLKSLQNEKERELVIHQVLSRYSTVEFSADTHFYRIRLNPKKPYDFSEYDAAPSEFLGLNRFDDLEFPVLYASPDLELCIHECRATAEDAIYAAKLQPARILKLLDLTSIVDADETEFESLDLALHFLFLASKHSYPICRKISRMAKEAGYDGILYPSYFSYIRTGMIPFETSYGLSIRVIPELKTYAHSQSVPNIILFGRPIEEKLIVLDCINRVIINQVSYQVTFGPVYHKTFEPEVYMQKKTNDFLQKMQELHQKKLTE